MKLRNYTFILTLIISLLYFNSSTVIADEAINEDTNENVEIVEEEEEEVDHATDMDDVTNAQDSNEAQDQPANNEIESSSTKSGDSEKQGDNKSSEQESTMPSVKENSINSMSNTVLQKGMRHPSVIDLKKDLAKVGFPVPGNGTNYFGTDTEATVESFQKYYGLQVDGSAGPQTLNKIKDILSSPLQNRNRHPDTIQLKKDLALLGYQVPGNGTDLFGPSTEKKVREFQNDNGLVVNGIADEVTLATISEQLPTELKNGTRHKAVIQLKQDLAYIGFPVPGSGTSYFGPDTERVVKRFQSYYGIPSTGIADENTLTKIEEIVTTPLQYGFRHPDSIQLKKNLSFLAMPVPGSGTNYYGAETQKKVKDFQKKHNLVVNGIADQRTLAKIRELVNEPMSNGVYRQDVVELKKDLAKLGFKVPGSGTPLFGKETERKVREFQKYYQISVDGIAGPETLNQIKNEVTSPLQFGKRHQDTVQLKKDLAFLVMPVSGNGTTYFGSGTEQRVREFQKKNNLIVNGIADSITLKMISQLVNAPMSNGVYRQDVVQLKKDLAKLGFRVPGNGTPLFGNDTEKKVRDFQRYYYDLSVDGVAGPATLAKIRQVLSSPLQFGKRHSDTVQLKEDLAILGYPVEGNGTNYYGKGTEQRIKEFQSDHKLVINGIADEVTLAKIKDSLSNILKYGTRHSEVIQLKKDLSRLGFEVQGSEATSNYFDKETEIKVKELQTYYGLTVNGIADDSTLSKIREILSSPLQFNRSHKDTIKLKEDLAKLGYHISSKPTNLYGKVTEQKVKEFQVDNKLAVSGIAEEVTLRTISQLLSKYVKKTNYNLTLSEALNIQLLATPQTDTKYAWVSKEYIDTKNIVTANLNVRSGPGVGYRSLGLLSKGTEVKVIDQYNGWYAINYNHSTQWVHASPINILYYLDPINFLNDEKQIFQFLDLSKPSGASQSVLNRYLKGKGILEDYGQAFINAGRQNNLNDVYLISHAILETGNGTSELAQGVKYNGVTVYNMYGIGAYDSCPIDCGAKRAFEEGWTTPEKAIIGGAKFIGNDYIKAGLNTLYKMRWNPQAMVSTGRYGKQYATDIGWASKQINLMYNLYQEIGSYKLYLDIPVYK